MDVIFILGASQAFFLSFMVFKKTSKSHADYVLGVWLAFIGLHLLDYYLMNTGFSIKHPHFLGVGVCFPLLQGPFMFVYVLMMISKSGEFKRLYWLHAMPFIIFSIYFIFDFYLLGAKEKLAYYKVLETEGSLVLSIVGQLNSLIGPLYVIWSLVMLRKHTKNISNNFSYTEDIDLAWLRYIVIGLGVVWSTVLFAYLLEFISTDQDLGGDLIYLSLTIAVFFLGYHGIKQQAIYVHSPKSTTTRDIPVKEELELELRDEKRYKRSGLKKEDAEQYLKKLLGYMDDERPYLDSKLSLTDVADHLEVSINHLSQVINDLQNKSFIDFINGYRVEEVKRLMSTSDKKQFTILALAYESGFNSKSSFNSNFKRITQLTPSQYLKTLRENDLS